VQLAERFPQLRAKPNLRAGYTFEVATPSHPQFAGKTNPAEYSFGFHALWNWLQPNRLSVSLSTWTIDNVEFSTPSREHVREYIQPGQSATVRVNA
jgi:hypothetical protein